MRLCSTGSMFVILLAMVVSSGCQEPPKDQIQEARTALDELVQAGVFQWAPEAGETAKDALAKVEAEVKIQGDKLGFLRDYKQTFVLVEDVKKAAATAKTAATEAKEKSRAEATESIVELEKALAKARDLLATAPTGKGSEADLEVMKADLDEVERAVVDAKSALEGERFAEVSSKVQAGLTRAEDVKASIQQAIAAVNAAAR